jgi:hypothetical protein
MLPAASRITRAKSRNTARMPKNSKAAPPPGLSRGLSRRAEVARGRRDHSSSWATGLVESTFSQQSTPMTCTAA